MGLSHHADLGVAQTPLCFAGLLPALLRVAPFLPRCILHTQILAKKKRRSAAEEPLPQVRSELVPKAADIDSAPELTQTVLYAEPVLSRASSQANPTSSPSTQPSDPDTCSHGRAVPQGACACLGRIPVVAEVVRSVERPFEVHWRQPLSGAWGHSSLTAIYRQVDVGVEGGLDQVSRERRGQLEGGEVALFQATTYLVCSVTSMRFTRVSDSKASQKGVPCGPSWSCATGAALCPS